MKRLALIAATMMAASVSAAASPWPEVHGKVVIKTGHDHDYYRYHPYQARRWDRDRWHGRYREARWSLVGDALSGRTNHQEIWLNGATFDQLVIQADRGAPFITQVGIDFGQNNGTQLVRLNRRLGRFGDDSQIIDVEGRGRPIQRVIVYTDPRFGGSYSLLGR